jgi:hypothetical protein
MMAGAAIARGKESCLDRLHTYSNTPQAMIVACMNGAACQLRFALMTLPLVKARFHSGRALQCQ